MVDINLGNKTLIVGVLIALILSYGMVNFDSGSSRNGTVPTIETSLDRTASSEPNSVPDQVLEASETAPEVVDDGHLSRAERRELRHQDRL